jgi:hypothetical protein
VQLNGNPDQTESGQANGGGHAAHLSVASLTEAEFQPIGRDRLARSDRRHPGTPWNVPELTHSCLIGQAVLDGQTLSQLFQLGFTCHPLHLHVVGPPVGPSGLTQAGLKGAVVRQNQQALAVGVQSARGVDARDGEDVREGPPAAVGLRSELAEHPEGLVQQKGLQGRWSWGRAQPIRIRSVLCRLRISA